MDRWLLFGGYRLDLSTGRLLEGEVPVRLPALPARLLLYLAINRHRTVPKSELLAEVWREVAVGDAAVHQALKQVRQAVGDDGRAQAVIGTEPGLGYRFVSEATEHVDRAARGDSYVGRPALLEQLTALAREAADGCGHVVLLSGEPGIGKSRTADEVAEVARRAGMIDVRGGASPRLGAPPFWPWVEVFRELAESRPVDELRRRVPTLLDPAADTSETGEAERFRNFDVASRCLRSAADLGPLVIILEDLHEASAATLELLEFVARGIERMPILILATYREPELRRSPARARVRSTLGELRSVRSMRVDELDESEIAELLERHALHPQRASVLRALARRTAGNPLLVLELARMLFSSPLPPDAVADRDRWLSRGAARLFAERLAALSPATRVQLRRASAMGTSFEPHRLTGLAGQQAAAAVAEAMDARLLVPADPAARTQTFRHGLTRDVLYEELGEDPRERARVHLQLAESIVTEGPGGEIEVARHLIEAEALADQELLVAYVRRAAARQLAMGDSGSAWDLYRRALTAASHAVSSERLRCELLVGAGAIGVRDSSADEARDLLREAMAIARRLEDGELFANAVAAYAFQAELVSTANEPLIALIEEALGMLGNGQPALQARLMSRLALELQYHPERPLLAESRLEAAIELAQTSGDSTALAQVLEDSSMVRWSLADPEGWRDLNHSIVRVAERAGNAELQFRGVKGLATAYLELGDRAQLEHELARCDRLAAAYPAPYMRAIAALLRASQAYLEARFSDAEQLTMEAASVGVGEIVSVTAVQVYHHRFELGRVQELEAATRALVERSPGIVAWRFALALLLLEAGCSDEAQACVEQAATDLAAIPHDRNWAAAMAMLCECLATLPLSELDEEVFAQLAPHVRSNVVLGNGSLFYGNIGLHAGRVAARLGRHTEAERMLDYALQMHERLEAPLWVLYTRLAKAELALAVGDSEAALAQASEVAERAGTSGYVACAARAADFVASATERTTTAGRVAGGPRRE